jgi:hypothetical protein
VFLWRSPHGYWFRVDHTGTHPLGKNPEAHQQDAVVDEWRLTPLEARLANLVIHRS